MKNLFALVLTLCVLALSACHNPYNLSTYVFTDTYGTVFEGERVPQDVR